MYIIVYTHITLGIKYNKEVHANISENYGPGVQNSPNVIRVQIFHYRSVKNSYVDLDIQSC